VSPDTLELTAQGRRLRAPAVVLGTGTAVLGRFLLAPLLPAIRDSLVLSSALAGSAVSLFALLSAITHFPAGRLADELSHQTVLIGGLSLLGIGSALLATTITTSQFLIALGLYGLGMGLFMPGGIVHLSAVFPERRGRVLGLNSGAAQLGGIGAALLSTVALARGSWQFAFIPVTGVIVLLTASIHIWRDQAYVVGRVQLDARETFGQLVVDADRRRAVLAAALLMIVMEGGFTFLPTFLRVSKSFPPSLASQAFGLIFVVGLVVNPLAGWGADHYRARTVAAGAVAVGIGGISTLILSSGTGALLAGIVLLGAGIGGFWPPFNAHLMQVLSADGRDSEYGAARALWVAIGSMGPAVIGVVGGAYGFDIAFVLLACILVGTLLTLTVQSRSK